MFNLSLVKEYQQVKLAFVRFPLSILCFALLATLIINIDIFKDITLINFTKLLPVLFMGGFLFTALTLQYESSGKAWLFVGIYLFAFAILGFFLYNQDVPFFQTALICLGFFGNGLSFNCWYTDQTRDQFWAFNYHFFSRAIFGVLIAGIVFGGISLILVTLDYLFGFKFTTHQYINWFTIAALWLTPLLILAGIPTRFDENPEPKEGNGLQALLNHVITPLLLIFGGLIIAYALTIVGSWSLPKGHIAYLVSAFGGFGILAYALGDRDHPNLSQVHLFFRRHFFKILLIPLVLMAIGLYVRLKQYGFTESRYIVTMIFVWLLAVAAKSFSQKGVGARSAISMASIILILAPLASNEICTRSQLCHLQNLLEENKILVNGKIIPAKSAVQPEVCRRVHSILWYLNFHHGLAPLSPWLTLKKEEMTVERIKSEMGLKEQCATQENAYLLSYTLLERPTNGGLHKGFSCKGYDHAIPDLYMSIAHASELICEVGGSEETLHVTLDLTKRTLMLKRKNGHILLTISLRDLVAKLKKESAQDLSKNMTFDGEDDTLKVCLIINRLSVYFSKEDPEGALASSGDLNMILLVKQR